jgi:hypothetical protein
MKKKKLKECQDEDKKQHKKHLQMPMFNAKYFREANKKAIKNVL